MADNVRRLPAERTLYFAVEESDVKGAMRGELGAYFCYHSLDEAEAVAAKASYEVTVLEVKVKPVSITRKVTEVERL